MQWKAEDWFSGCHMLRKDTFLSSDLFNDTNI